MDIRHQEAFMKLKDFIIQAPVLRYPNPTKRYIVYADASDDACGAHVTQEHDGIEFPIAFLSHTFLETQRKLSTMEQEAYGVYYAVTKWNCYLQGADIIVRNDHKALAKFLNGKNANNNVNRWGLKLATYNITFEWISGAKNKAADCLSHLVEPPSTPSASINMLSVSNSDGPAFNTSSQTQQLSVDFSYCWINLVEAWYSLEQYIGLKEDKLSSTTVDFIRSEGNLETKCLYWFSKPKMCRAQ